MYFSKYATHGAYHWRQYEKGGRYKEHADFINMWVSEAHVLDVGAGDGVITALLGIEGVDNEPEAVRLAQLKGANVKLGDAYSLPYKDKEFDAVLLIDVLEHLERPQDALREAKRVARHSLYVVTPPKRSDGKLTDKFHYQEWTPQELIDLVEAQGFRLEGDVLLRPKAMYAKFVK